MDIYETCKTRLYEGVDPNTKAVWDHKEWMLKDRRHVKWLADDIADLCMFASNGTNKFPKEILIKKYHPGTSKDNLGADPNKNKANELESNAILHENVATLRTEVEQVKGTLENMKPCMECAQKIKQVREEFTKEVTALQGLVAALNERLNKEPESQGAEADAGGVATIQPQKQPEQAAGDANQIAETEKNIPKAADNLASNAPMDLSKGKDNQEVPNECEKEWPALPKAVPPAHSSGGQDPNPQPRLVRAQDMAHGPANRSAPGGDGYARVLTNGEVKEQKEKNRQSNPRPPPSKQKSGNGSTFNLAGAPKIVTT